MGIAALQAQNLTLTARQSQIEYEIMITGNRRQSLSVQGVALLEEYMTKAQSETDDDTEITEEESTAFSAEYEAAQARLDAQDELMDLQTKQLESQQKALSTQVEGVQKQIQKNAEKEFNTSMG